MPATLLRRLGCRTEPRADDILTNLAKLRESGLALNRPDAVYRVLVVALRRERRRSGELRTAGHLDGWAVEAPGDCLVGADNRDAFLDAVTVLPDALRDDWVFLGAHRRPAEAHWVRLLVRPASDTAPGREYAQGRGRLAPGIPQPRQSARNGGPNHVLPA